MRCPFWVRGLGRVLLSLGSVAGWVAWYIVLAPLAWTHCALSILGGDEKLRAKCDAGDLMLWFCLIMAWALALTYPGWPWMRALASGT